MMEKEMFVLVEASKLSLDDEFMQYQPTNNREKELKNLLEAVIKKEIVDFWRPRMDPTLDKTGNICFKAGEKPAVGKSCIWWRDNAKKFDPMRKSKLGTKEQYVAFLGVLIKKLVAEGWMVAEAWNSVCNDSKKLGHYLSSENATYGFEPTGSRAIAGFYDLGNTCKIVVEDDEELEKFWEVGSDFGYSGYWYSLSTMSINYDCYDEYNSNFVGWIVLEC